MDTLNQFNTRFKISKNNMIEDNDPRILRIRCEDFILNHAETESKIINLIVLNSLN